MNNVYISEITSILNNDKDLFYKARSLEVLIEVWIQLKSKLDNYTSGFNNETLQGISKQLVRINVGNFIFLSFV